VFLNKKTLTYEENNTILDREKVQGRTANCAFFINSGALAQ